MVDNTWVPGYQASQSSVTFSDPSQYTFDLNASAPVGEPSTVEETLAAGYELLQILSTFPGPADPSQPSLDFGAGTSNNGSTTVDNTLAEAYEVSHAFYASLGLSQPTFDLNAGAASFGEFSTVGETLAAGHELMEFLSTLSGPGDPSQPIFDLDAADDESAYDHLTGLKALLFTSTPSGGTNRSMPTKNGSRRRRRANASSGQMATNNLIPDTLTTASFPSGSDSQPSMVAFNPSFPGDRAIDVSDASATSSYPFSFGFSGLTSAGNVNASQPYTSIPGAIGGTSYSYNDAWTSNMFGGETIGTNEQEQAIFSSQMSRPLFDYGMTGGQSTDMDTRTHEEDFDMDISFSAVDTMQPSSSSLFNALGSGNVSASQPCTSVPGTIGSTSYSYNDAWTSNMFGGETIGTNEQEQAIFSSQMSRPLFNYGMTGGQSTGMDTRTHEEDSGMDTGSSVVDTMQPSSSSLFNALG